jgi:hypothetical protein
MIPGILQTTVEMTGRTKTTKMRINRSLFLAPLFAILPLQAAQPEGKMKKEGAPADVETMSNSDLALHLRRKKKSFEKIAAALEERSTRRLIAELVTDGFSLESELRAEGLFQVASALDRDAFLKEFRERFEKSILDGDAAKTARILWYLNFREKNVVWLNEDQFISILKSPSFRALAKEKNGMYARFFYLHARELSAGKRKKKFSGF